jgi:hypothetical protein
MDDTKGRQGRLDSRLRNLESRGLSAQEKAPAKPGLKVSVRMFVEQIRWRGVTPGRTGQGARHAAE